MELTPSIDSNQGQVILDVNSRVTLQDLVRVARGFATVSAEHGVVEKIEKARQVVDHFINESAPPIYGLTTGLGSLKKVRVSNELLLDYNQAVIMDHAVAVGPEAPLDVVRGTMFARLAALATGGSGVSPETFRGLLALLNSGVIPVVRMLGSVGEADLAPLADIGTVLIGKGEAWYKGTRMQGDLALSKAGIEPLTLQPKDGLILVGANSFSAAVAGIALWDIQRDAQWSEVAATLSWAAFRANSSTLNVDIIRQRGPEAVNVGQRLLAMLHETKYQPQSIQDPLSFRCIPQVHGALAGAIARTETAVLAELTHSLDNPMVDVSANHLFSNGNFDPTEMVLHCDSLRNALYRIIVMLERRAGKLLSSHFSGLPTGLTSAEGYSGLDILPYTLISLTGEATRLAQVAAVQSGMAAEGIDDIGSSAAQSAINLRKLESIWRTMIAIEMLVAVRALQLADVKPGPFIQQIKDTLEAVIDGKETPAEKVRAIEHFIQSNDCFQVGHLQ
ncbi:aromatic amino acid lyase [Neobacillus cucumis]|uniref:aromatic amino acid ammonia-lyase n=1 Tax=Neobacillus cucumis TaxID=1740721 RepID=UPI0018DF8613|nr:aromatic amino acid ammonia-lyase [Neobacillus cucumis]MBI0579946.1 aromatic amino acid lyase [Neobacillus cucumis]